MILLNRIKKARRAKNINWHRYRPMLIRIIITEGNSGGTNKRLLIITKGSAYIYRRYDIQKRAYVYKTEQELNR